MGTYQGYEYSWVEYPSSGTTGTITFEMEEVDEPKKPIMTSEQIKRFAWLRGK